MLGDAYLWAGGLQARNNSQGDSRLKRPNWERLVRLQVHGRAESPPIIVPVQQVYGLDVMVDTSLARRCRAPGDDDNKQPERVVSGTKATPPASMSTKTWPLAVRRRKNSTGQPSQFRVKPPRSRQNDEAPQRNEDDPTITHCQLISYRLQALL